MNALTTTRYRSSTHCWICGKRLDIVIRPRLSVWIYMSIMSDSLSALLVPYGPVECQLRSNSALASPSWVPSTQISLSSRFLCRRHTYVIRMYVRLGPHQAEVVSIKLMFDEYLRLHITPVNLGHQALHTRSCPNVLWLHNNHSVFHSACQDSSWAILRRFATAEPIASFSSRLLFSLYSRLYVSNLETIRILTRPSSSNLSRPKFSGWHSSRLSPSVRLWARQLPCWKQGLSRSKIPTLGQIQTQPSCTCYETFESFVALVWLHTVCLWGQPNTTKLYLLRKLQKFCRTCLAARCFFLKEPNETKSLHPSSA